MKRLHSFLLIFVCISFLTQCKNSDSNKKEFEGVVIYSLNVKSKIPNVDSREIQRNFGNAMIYTYKNGNYKMEFNGPDSPTIYYLAKNNHQYTIFPDGDTLWTSDCTLEPSKLLRFEVKKKKVNILGTDCQMIESELEGDLKYTYFFDPKRYVNPEHFKNHKMGYVNQFYKSGKGLILQYKREGNSFDLMQTAVKVEEKEIDPQVFNLPGLPQKSLDDTDY